MKRKRWQMSEMPKVAVVDRSPDAKAISVVHSVRLEESDLALRLIEQSEKCVKLLSIDGKLEFMNCGGMKAMEIDDPSAIYGKFWWTLWPLNAQDMVRSVFDEAIGGTTSTFEATCPTAKGNPRRWSVNLKPICSRAGPVVSVLATSREIPFRTED